MWGYNYRTMDLTRRSGSVQQSRRFFGLLLILAILAALPTGLAAAQTSGVRLALRQADSSQFPTITLNFEAYDDQGRFNTALEAAAVSALEDGQSIQADQLSLQQPGLQLTLALNTGPTLAYTYNNLSRFDQVRKVIYDWAKTQPPDNGVDDYSLVASGGSLGTHMADPQQFAQALISYAPDLMKNQPTLASLIQSLDLATDPLRRPQMKRTVLYVTPLLPDSALQALPNLASRANQLGIRVFVWLVETSPAGDTGITQALRGLAATTGGQFFSFSGSEPFPDVESYFQPLRYYYRLSYTSNITKSGEHTTAVRLNQGSPAPTSAAQPLNLTILPPNPMFLSPPAKVQRSWVDPGLIGGDRANAEAPKPVLSPERVRLDIMVEFPDGFPRRLKAARLYVDNKLASEITSPPFSSFDWPLTDYTTSAHHSVRVEVEDQLGLVHSSIATPVDVVVDAPPPPAGLTIFGIQAARLLLPAAGVLAAIAIIILGVWLFRLLRARRKARQRRPSPARPRLKMPAPLPAVRRILPQGNAPARLMRLAESGHVQPGSAVPLGLAEITIGRDAKRAAYVLESPSVSGLHARLCQSPEGQFTLYDAGSVSGTWVNYHAVGEDGVLLQHGDVVQIGRETFRFELNRPTPRRVPQVIALDGPFPDWAKPAPNGQKTIPRRSRSPKPENKQ